MSKKTLAVIAVGIAVVFLFASAGCVSKKRLRTVEQEHAEQMAQANARIDELVENKDGLDKELKLAQDSLAGAQSENKTLAAKAASLKDQLAALESQKAELDKALASGKETEASYQKKVRGLNGLITGLRKDVAEMESQIAAKDEMIASLRESEARLTAASEEQSRQMAALNSEKDDLSATLDKTIAGKKSTTLILGILLALAVILAIVGFVRGRKGPSAA
jgi:chromosome segregation ATPase